MWRFVRYLFVFIVNLLAPVYDFVAMYYLLLVQHHLSQTNVDNILNWDRAVLVAALVLGLEIDFVKLLITVIHERSFKTSTSYPFACLIFHLCRDVILPICHFDTLRSLVWTGYIGLIKDETNVAAP